MEALGSVVARATFGASRAAGWALSVPLAVGLSACGGAWEGYSSIEASLQLTAVGLKQYANPPTPVPGSEDLPARQVTVDVTLIFLAPEKPETLTLVFTGSEGTSENRIDLTTTSLADSTGGRQTFRTLITVPNLGVLPFDAVLIDRAGASSATVSGRFTIADSLTVTQSDQFNESNEITTQQGP
jgi:hypothetical protein